MMPLRPMWETASGVVPVVIRSISVAVNIESWLTDGDRSTLGLREETCRRSDREVTQIKCLR
jgi:hypothetical protein